MGPTGDGSHGPLVSYSVCIREETRSNNLIKNKSKQSCTSFYSLENAAKSEKGLSDEGKKRKPVITSCIILFARARTRLHSKNSFLRFGPLLVKRLLLWFSLLDRARRRDRMMHVPVWYLR